MEKAAPKSSHYAAIFALWIFRRIPTIKCAFPFCDLQESDSQPSQTRETAIKEQITPKIEACVRDNGCTLAQVVSHTGSCLPFIGLRK